MRGWLMPAVRAPGLTVTQDEQDIGEDAAVAAAIRVHDWVQRNLRRLAKEIALPGYKVEPAVPETRPALHWEAVEAGRSPG
jgi:hypothetical protein